MVDHTYDTLTQLSVMHCVFFILMLLIKLCKSFNKNSYLPNIVLVPIVPMYAFVIFQAYYKICKLERIAVREDCNGLTFILKRAWIYIEISAFMINIFQLMLSLCARLKPGGGGECCNKKLDEWINLA